MLIAVKSQSVHLELRHKVPWPLSTCKHHHSQDSSILYQENFYSETQKIKCEEASNFAVFCTWADYHFTNRNINHFERNFPKQKSLL